jgi:hypothetical protein
VVRVTVRIWFFWIFRVFRVIMSIFLIFRAEACTCCPKMDTRTLVSPKNGYTDPGFTWKWIHGPWFHPKMDSRTLVSPKNRYTDPGFTQKWIHGPWFYLKMTWKWRPREPSQTTVAWPASSWNVNSILIRAFPQILASIQLTSLDINRGSRFPGVLSGVVRKKKKKEKKRRKKAEKYQKYNFCRE